MDNDGEFLPLRQACGCKGVMLKVLDIQAVLRQRTKKKTEVSYEEDRRPQGYYQSQVNRKSSKGLCALTIISKEAFRDSVEGKRSKSYMALGTSEGRGSHQERLSKLKGGTSVTQLCLHFPFQSQEEQFL